MEAIRVLQEEIGKYGLSVSRDHNAVINILKRATVGHTGSNACGVVAMATAMKQEAHLL